MQQQKKLAENVKKILEHFGADLNASGEPEGKPELEEMVQDIGEESHANS